MALRKPMVVGIDGIPRPIKPGDLIAAVYMEGGAPTNIPSNPPSGGYKVVNIYLNSSFVPIFEYDDTPEP